MMFGTLDGRNWGVDGYVMGDLGGLILRMMSWSLVVLRAVFAASLLYLYLERRRRVVAYSMEMEVSERLVVEVQGIMPRL
jgi:hypothetical protein